MLQQAVGRGLPEGFLQFLNVFIEVRQNYMGKTKRTIKIVYLTLHIFYILELITINAL
jgi:hypothetical protein